MCAAWMFLPPNLLALESLLFSGSNNSNGNRVRRTRSLIPEDDSDSRRQFPIALCYGRITWRSNQELSHGTVNASGS